MTHDATNGVSPADPAAVGEDVDVVDVAVIPAQASKPGGAEGPGDGAKLIIVIQQKGGAGKTTLTVNLAAVSGEANPAGPDEDAPVIAAGIDPQGSLEHWARRVPEKELPFDYQVTRGRLGEIPGLLREPGVRRVWADTPGWIELDPDAPVDADPLGEGRAADALRELLDHAALALVPVVPVESMTWGPAEFTVEYVLKPRGIPFLMVINNWDSGRDPGSKDLEHMRAWCEARGYPCAPHPVRRYKVHAQAAEHGMTVLQYADNGTTLRAKQDFYKLALAVEAAL